MDGWRDRRWGGQRHSQTDEEDGTEDERAALELCLRERLSLLMLAAALSLSLSHLRDQGSGEVRLAHRLEEVLENDDRERERDWEES